MKHVTQLDVSFANERVGTLALYNRQFWFEYDAHWLQHGFDLSPQTLNFTGEPQLAKLSLFQGLHGVFHDSLPDGWGLLLMDRFFKRQFNWDYQEITPLDRLAYLGTRAMGALEYKPVIAQEKVNNTIDLMTLAHDVEQILAGKARTILNQLRILGGSPGGARPKITVGLAPDNDDCVTGLMTLPANFNYWIVKFRGEQDPPDIGRIEKAYAELAVKAGLEMPPSRLIHASDGRKKEDFFAVQRFDRKGHEKRHMLSLSSYIYADHRIPSLDYNALLAATFVLTEDIREVKRAFRLMIFNIATHNKDDHAKNFSFVYDREKGWRLAPGYDLTFSNGMNNEHMTSVNGNGNPSRKDIQAVAMANGIHDWELLLDDVLSAISNWQKIAKNYQVTKLSMDRITRAFNKINRQLE